MRSVRDTVAWFQEHEVYPTNLDFDPDGMCLKICRTARDIGPVYPSAVAAQEATPVSYRVDKIRDLRRGMVIYFDDPKDSNPFGHVATIVGRIEGSDPDALGDILVRSNNVKANEIVVVRGDYFQRHWGDEFQFGATWLNGQRLTLGEAKPKPKPKPKKPLNKATNLKKAIKDLEKAAKYHEGQKHTRLVNALQRDIQSIQNTIDKFS